MKMKARRILSMALALVMALGLLPLASLAAPAMLGEAGTVAETPVADHVHAETAAAEQPAVSTRTSAREEEQSADLLALQEHNFTTSGTTSSFFTISGNLSTGKGTVTYEGLTLTQCLKIESSTSISFTATEAGTLTLVFVESAPNIKIDGTKYTGSDGIIAQDLAAGSHTITKADTMNLFYMSYGSNCAHNWGDGVVTTEPTCTETGVKTYTCSLCGTTKIETVDALGHQYGSDGVCTVCGEHEHQWVLDTTTPATCGAAGEETYHCSVDGCTETKTVTLPATGDHSYEDGVCTVCGAKEVSGFLKESGDLETAYIEWVISGDYDGYNAYVKPLGGSYTQLDDELLRQYPGYMRADALGLKAGQYVMKVVPVKSGSEVTDKAMETGALTVEAHDRSGFGFVNGTSSGAYNDDGTLKSNAQVVYITTDAELEALLNSSSIWSGKGVTTPTCVRVIGHVQADDVLGFQEWTCGLTVEGVGNDATLTGGGVFVKKCSNVEVRNLAVFHVHSGGKNDLIAVEQTNDHVWVHNNDLFYGFAGGGDQAKGDGSLDVKDAEYCSFSFNHFWDSGKSSLLGNNSTENYITYHHNWFDHSDSRHPRTRSGNVHIYNNYYDGNSKYGIGCTSGKGGSGKTSIFVEGNYFRNTKYPMLNSKQASDADGSGGTNTFSGDEPGFIKAYNNVMVGSKSFVSQNDDPSSFDAYVVSSRSETIPSSVTVTGGSSTQTYSNFDTTADLGVDAADVQSPADAVVTVTQWAGRVQGGDIQYVFNNDVEDSNYAVIDELDDMLTNYESKLLSVGGTITQTSSGAVTECAHTNLGTWKTTKAPGCDPDTQELIDGEQTQYCLDCGEAVNTRTVAGAHSNDGSGVCTVCGATVSNSGGAVASGGKTLQATSFTMHEVTGDKSNTAAMRDEDMAAVVDGYYSLYGSGVNKRTKNATTVGSQVEWIDLPKSGNGGIQFTVTDAPATVSVTWGNTGGGQTSTMVIKNASGDILSTEDLTSTDNSTKTSTTYTVTEAGTYIVASAAGAGYSVRLYTLSVAETSSTSHTHTWGAWVTVTPATCVDAGEQKRECSSCGEVQTGEIAATGEHTYENGVCTVCGEEEPQTDVNASGTLGYGAELKWTCASGSLTVTANAGDVADGDKVLAACYNASGAFLGAKLVALDTPVALSGDASKARLFWLSGVLAPKGASVTVGSGSASTDDPSTEPSEDPAPSEEPSEEPTPSEEPSEDPTPAESKTYTLTSDEVLKALDPSHDVTKDFTNPTVGPVTTTDNFFTIYPKVNSAGTYDALSIKNISKWNTPTWADGYAPSTAINGATGSSMTQSQDTTTGEVTDKISNVYGFTVSAPATVKVWYTIKTNGDADGVGLFAADQLKAVATGLVTSEASKGAIATVEAAAAGTYYLGGVKTDGSGGKIIVSKVEVTVQ